jgi:hypothetical protein
MQTSATMKMAIRSAACMKLYADSVRALARLIERMGRHARAIAPGRDPVAAEQRMSAIAISPTRLCAAFATARSAVPQVEV